MNLCLKSYINYLILSWLLYVVTIVTNVIGRHRSIQIIQKVLRLLHSPG